MMTLGGPILADVPFIKGTAELFEVILDDGSKFTATANHRVLTPDGYRFVSELSVGSTLTGYALSHPQTTLGIAPSVQNEDARHCLSKAQDSQSDCRPSFCSGDEPPLFSKAVGQCDLTLPIGAQEHISSSFLSPSDDPACKAERSHHHQTRAS